MAVIVPDTLSLGLSTPDIQSINSASGAALVSSIQDSKIAHVLPWATSGINSKFFRYIEIDENRWDQLFPYRLLVIDSTNNLVVYGPKGQRATPEITISPGTSSALVTFDAPAGWIFQLPITPQQLSIQDQFAINTSATLRGVSEEHSGVRFKIINAQGTMGVWPQRSSVTRPPESPSIIQSIFGGTIEALGSVINQVGNVINAATGNHPANKPVSLRPETSDFTPVSTGYYQALKLAQFLEQYAEAKRNPTHASWRLVFDIPKQNQSFIVTPVMYDWLQNASKPMEIMYKFQLKAWRRIDLKQTPKELPLNNFSISPGILQRILSTISQARQTLSSVINLIGAVRSDVEAPLDVLRQTSLFVKDLAGVTITAADLPRQLVSDYRSSIASSLSNIASAITTFKSIPSLYSSAPTAATSNADNRLGFNSTAVASSDSKIRQNLQTITDTQTQNEGLSMSAISGGQLGNPAAITQSLNATNHIFEQSDANFALLDQASLSSLSLNNAQQNTVNQVIQNARETTVDTLKQYRVVIQQLSLQLSNSFGTGSDYYDQIYGLPSSISRIQPITLDEYDILKSLYDVMASYDILTATTEINDNNTQSNMDYVAGLAANADIVFNNPTSKVLAPVPFGLTIEAISARYLGDPQRWLEIATLNNLREPYIDENGFQLSLLSNAIGRQITVNSIENLYIGQKVILRSSTQTQSARTILEIEQLSDISFLLTLDGLSNLDNFLTIDKAYIQAYLGGTVNSQQKIYIPSDLPISDTSNIIPPPSTASDPLTALSKVDLLLTDSGDLAINNYGDFRFSYGITNIIQALRIKFGTRANTIITHPNFGLNVKPGSINSELQIQELYNSINKMIQEDPRFQQVNKLQITLNGPILGINLAVTLPGQTGVFPVSFALSA